MGKNHQLDKNSSIPVIGFGTWNLNNNELKQALKTALDTGYQHIDTAEGYKNEAVIGEVLTEYNRQNIFLTSKVLPSNLNYENVIQSCKHSLEKLKTDYLDLYLIHWPNPAISLRETLWAMKKLKGQGLVKNIGVSNFSRYQLNIALKITPVPIKVNQVEFHPYRQHKNLREFCSKNDIILEAAAPLARGEVLEDNVINKLAKKYDKTPAEIVLRWEREHGVVPLPKSSSQNHIKQNLSVLNWEMEQKDIKQINQINKEKKVYNLSVDDDIYGISS